MRAPSRTRTAFTRVRSITSAGRDLVANGNCILTTCIVWLGIFGSDCSRDPSGVGGYERAMIVRETYEVKVARLGVDPEAGTTAAKLYGVGLEPARDVSARFEFDGRVVNYNNASSSIGRVTREGPSDGRSSGERAQRSTERIGLVLSAVSVDIFQDECDVHRFQEMILLVSHSYSHCSRIACPISIVNRLFTP